MGFRPENQFIVLFWRIKVIFKVLRSIKETQIGRSVIPVRLSHVILFLTNKARNMCNTSFQWDFDGKIHFFYYLGHLRSSSRAKSQFQGQI